MKRINGFEKFKDDYQNINESKLGDWIKKQWNKITGKYGDDAWIYALTHGNYAGVDFIPAGEIPASMKEDIIKPSGNYNDDDYDFDRYNKKKKIERPIPKWKRDKMALAQKQDEEIEDETQIQEGLEHDDESIRPVDAALMKSRILKSFKYKLDTGELSSVFIWGAPGIGKTMILEEVAHELDVDLIVLHLSQIDPTDFRGVPTVVKKEDTDEFGKTRMRERTKQALPDFFPTSNGTSGKGGILFFDELNASDRMVLRAALPLCLDGAIQGYKIPSKWIIVAAGNRQFDVEEGDVERLNAPLADRFRHLNYEPTVEGWVDWAMPKKYIDPRLIAFMMTKRNAEYFHKIKENEDEDQKMNWPSPRGWSKASAWVAWETKGKFDMPISEMQGIYHEHVGLEAANAFIDYVKLVSIISEKEISELYEKGKSPKVDVNKLPVDRKYAVLTAIAYFKKGNKKEFTAENYKNLIDWGFKTLVNFEERTTLFAGLKLAHTVNGECYLETESPWKEVRDEMTEEWYKQLTEIFDEV